MRLGTWQRAALAVNIIVAAGVGAYGAAGSYTSVFHLAAGHHVPLPHLVPVGVDGGLALTVLTDIVLTWIGIPIWWLRAVARCFVAGTVAANAAAGWPDPVAVFLHCFPPMIVLIVVEAGRASLLRSQAASSGREPIPLTRWLVSPLATPALWRRMAQWGEKSYTHAVTIEVTRRQAIMQLRQHYGRNWRAQAPDDLIWLLKTGNRIGEACARVEALTGTGTSAQGTPGTGRSRNPAHAGSRNRRRSRGTGTRNRPGTAHRGTGGNLRGPAAGTRPADPAGSDAALLAEARRVAAGHLQATGRKIKVAELALKLGRRKQVAGALLREIDKERPDEEAAR